MEAYVIEGEIVFMWGYENPPYCGCCPPFDKSVPHRHNFNRHIEVPKRRSEKLGWLLKDFKDHVTEFLHSSWDLEGKRVRVTFEIIE